MFRSVLAVVVVGLQVAIAGAQRDTDVAAPRCKDVQKLMSSADAVLLDVEKLASVKNDIQRVLDCLPRGGAIQLDVPKLDLGGTLLIRRSLSITGLLTSIRCPHGNMRPIIDVRADDVLLAGLSLAGCKLNGPSGLIEVKGSQNVTLKDVAFENNANTDGPACVSAIESTIQMQTIGAKNNTGMNGGAMSFAKASEAVIVGSVFEHNHASEWGGAIHTHNSNCSISDSLFVANHAFDGGGALLAKGDVGSKLSIENTMFYGNGEYKNCSIKSRGGGIALLGPKLTAEVSGATFVNNSACTGGAIHVFDVTKVAIQDSGFTDNFAFRGGALYIETNVPQVGILQVDQCSFIGNSAQGTVEGLLSSGGAAAIFNNGTEAAFHNCALSENKAGGFGGALGAHMAGKVTILGCHFFRNTVGNMSLSGEQEDSPDSGGAIYSWLVPEIFVAKSNFGGNYAKKRGGAAYILDASEVVIVDSFFDHNHASEWGGAIHTHNSNCSISDSLFVANHAFDGGGALLAKGDVGSKLSIEDALFDGNGEYKNCSIESRGGGIALFGPKLTAEVSGATFLNNSACTGGAIHVFDVTKVAIQDSIFNENFAFRGGALYIEVGILQVDRCSFASNSAQGTVGGFSPMGGVAAIFNNGTEAAFHNCSLFKNKAGGFGGALGTHMVGKVKILGCEFIENMVGNMSLSGEQEATNASLSFSNGGAVSVKSANAVFILKSNFTRNRATGGLEKAVDNSPQGVLIMETDSSFGGAVSMEDVEQTFIVESNFTRNSAGKGGGVALASEVEDSSIIIREAVFDGNIARGNLTSSDGGAMALFGKNLQCTIAQSTFRKNRANANGGAILALGIALLQLERSTFLENSGGVDSSNRELPNEGMESKLGNHFSSGGAIYVENISEILAMESNFTGNRAMQGGGVLLHAGENSTLVECIFTGNRAENGGALFAEGDHHLLQDGFLTMRGLEFSGNRAGSTGTDLASSLRGQGGAVVVTGILVVNINRCHFARNMAGSGGSLYFSESSKLKMSNSTISLSAAFRGGGLALVDMTYPVELAQVAFSKNSATWGGGVFVKLELGIDVPKSKMEFTDVEFWRNTAVRGGAGLAAESVQLECRNCEFIQNAAGNGGEFGDGGGIMASLFSILTLENSIVRDCSAGRSGGGMYIQDAALVGINLTVMGNTAGTNGGGVKIQFTASLARKEDIPLLWNCTSCIIEDNKSRIGGGLHSSTKMQPVGKCQSLVVNSSSLATMQGHGNLLDCRLSSSFFRFLVDKSQKIGYLLAITDTTISKNVAEAFGSGVFSNDVSVMRICCRSKCYHGSGLKDAPQYCKTRGKRGSNIGSVSIGSATESLKLIPSQFHGQMSEEALPTIEVRLLDAFGQMTVEKRTLRIQSMALDMELYGNPVVSDGIFVSSRFNAAGVIPRALPGTYNVTFELTPRELDSTPIIENLTIVIRECEVGEIPKHRGKQCELCEEDFFSFDPKDKKCRLCPLERAKCAGAVLVPLQGFWHANTRAIQLHPCMVLEGCTYANRTSILEEASKKAANNVVLNFADSYPQCAEGYTGVLCGGCQHSHGKIRSQKCMECGGRAPAIVFLTLMVLILGLLSFVFMESAGSYSKEINSENSDVSISGRSMPPRPTRGFNLEAFLAGRIPIEENEQQQLSPCLVLMGTQASDVFKILVNFLQVTASAAAIKVDWSKSMLALLASLGLMSGATNTSFFASECAFWANGLPQSIKATVLLISLPGFVWAAFSAWYLIRSVTKENRLQYFKFHLFTALLAVMHASYLSVTTEVVRIFYCVRAEPLDGLFWAEDTSVVCYRASHAYLTGFIGLPFLAMVTVGFPGWLLFVLSRNKANLTDASMAKRYGFFYKSYKKNTVIWEVVILARKALVSIIVVFSRPLGDGLQGDMALMVLFVSTIMQVHFQPFKDPKLNNMELASLLLSSIALMIGNIASKASVTKNVNIGMSVMFIGAVLVYFSYMAKQFYDAGMRGIKRWARKDPRLTT